MTAAHLGKRSPLKALFPIVAGNDSYRDIVFDGGLLDAEFDTVAVTTIFGPLEELNPVAESSGPSDLLAVEQQHAPGLVSYNASQLSNIGLGGDQGYDGSYWHGPSAPQHAGPSGLRRHPGLHGRWLVRSLSARRDPQLHGPAEPVGPPARGGADVAFTAGHRPLQLLYGPWYHLTATGSFAGRDLYPLQLAWFDRWLKNEPTGIERTRTPLHVTRWGQQVETTCPAGQFATDPGDPRCTWGAPEAAGRRARNDGALLSTPPGATSANDQTAYTAVSNPCNASLEQWGAGGGALALESGQLPQDPCTSDDRSFEASPGALTYTTAALRAPAQLAGPMDATIYATRPVPRSSWWRRWKTSRPAGKPCR